MGKAWDIWSCVVTSGRQRVDTWAWLSNSCFMLNHPWHCEQRMVLHDAAIAIVLASSRQTDSTRKGFEILCQVLPPMCVPSGLPDITASDQISQAFPLYICILQAIKYWRWEQTGNKAKCMHLLQNKWHKLISKILIHSSTLLAATLSQLATL